MVKKAIETDQTRETSMHFFGQRNLVSLKKVEDSIILKSFQVIEFKMKFFGRMEKSRFLTHLLLSIAPGDSQAEILPRLSDSRSFQSNCFR